MSYRRHGHLYSKPIKTKDVGTQIEKPVPDPFGELDNGETDGNASSSLQPAAEIFDRDALFDVVGGNASYVDELVAMFLRSEQEYVDTIHTAVAQNDSAATRSAAHALQGMLGSIAANAARGAACSLEDLAVTGDLSGAAPLLARLDDEMERLRATLSTEA